MTEIKKLFSLTDRNIKCYFKDKMVFFSSLLTPLILLFLFFTFLRNIYIDGFKSAFPPELTIDNGILNGIAGAWLLSSILSVSSVTVAFCANMVMVDDKISFAVNDFKISPVKPTTISLSYFISNFFVTFLIMACVLVLGSIYLAVVGWYLLVADFFLIIAGCISNILFGTLLSSIVLCFVSTVGVQSAVATLVSALYGFICGAYMPVASFSKGLRNVLGLLPGTYGTSIMRNHCMGGYFEALKNAGVPTEAINGIKDNFDVNIYLFDNKIEIGTMYGILLGTCAILLIAYVMIVTLRNKNIDLKSLFKKLKRTNNPA